jgi:hypothetical protein
MPRTRAVFLDTQVFDQELYNVRSKKLSRLLNLVSDGHARVVITDIALREITSNIRDMTRAAILSIKRANKARETNILRQLGAPFDVLFTTHDVTNISSQIEREFDTYCEAIGIELLPLSLATSSLGSIVEDYFEMRPPFKEGKKRSEFPDAISAAILRSWCKKHDKHVCVVTDDDDWSGLCVDRLSHFKSLTDFFALFPDHELARQLAAALKSPQASYVVDEIKGKFLDLSFFLSGVEGQVDEVTGVEVEIKRVVIVQAEKGRAVAEAYCFVRFDASITYVIPNTGIWNSDAEMLVHSEEDDEQVGTSTFITAEITFTYDENNSSSITQLDDVSLDKWSVIVDCEGLLGI